MIGLLTLSDGRKLQWSDNDIESDEALVLHHGTTIAMDVWKSWQSEAAAQGVRAIAINRPGVDQSSRKKGRRVIDDINDLRELVAHLNLQTFVAVGWSGGGARALGSALLDSCIAVHTIAGISPLNPYDPTTFAGISEARIERTKEFLADYSEVVRDRGATYEEDLQFTFEQTLAILSEFPNFADFEADYTAFAEDFKDSVLKSLVNGPEIDADDYFANISAWGFALSEVQKPVTIWHGDQDDDVIISRGEYNHQQLPNSEFRALPGQGHISIMVEARDEILAAAVASLQAAS